MDAFQINKSELEQKGFSIIDSVYSQAEIDSILKFIESQDSSSPTFRKSEDLFAIRQFTKNFPEIKKLVFNEKLKSVISSVAGEDFFIVKSIYFDKPETSNWFVAYHQDLTISVDNKENIEGFGPWTTKQINLPFSLR